MPAEAASIPRTFSEVPGWRESFREAARRLDEIRTGSLFPSIADTLCGERVRALTLADWTILEHAQNPFVSGTVRTVPHAVKIVWMLSRKRCGDSRITRFRQAWLVGKILRRARYDELGIIEEVDRFIDDAFLDMPGRFSPPSKEGGRSAVNWPRKAMEIELCGEIMAQFPSFTYADLRALPLAQFWQWLHEARAQFSLKNNLPTYRNHQLTDEVNLRANEEVNRQMREAAQPKQ